MRRTQRAWAAVLLCAATGCLDRTGGSGWRAHKPGEQPAPALARSLAPALPAEGFYAESVLVERPAGDRFLDRDIWSAGLAVGNEETQALLAENGLKAVVLGGNLPPGFIKLIGSEPDTVNPLGLTFANRKEAVIATNAPADPCEFTVRTSLAGKPTPVTLRQAKAGFLVRPEAGANGKVKVWCEPQLQHGDRRDFVRPTADATGFTVQGELPLERYPSLGFEVALEPKEYLVIGGPAAEPGSLAAALFSLEAGGRPRQRVLVVRLSKLGEQPASDLPAVPHLRRPSIAAEASRR